MFNKIIFSVLIITNIITAAFCFRLNYRLGKTRQQLEHYRVELSAATDRQSELAEILRRDGEILRESSTTISGIRSQIAVIRESYEKMESLLYNTGSNNSSNDIYTNHPEIKEEK